MKKLLLLVVALVGAAYLVFWLWPARPAPRPGPGTVPLVRKAPARHAPPKRVRALPGRHHLAPPDRLSSGAT